MSPGVSRSSSRDGLLFCIGIVAALYCFYIVTMRAGHGWGGDFALYLMHARNLAFFREYTHTAFLYDAGGMIMSPRNYPPMLPLVLAPVVRFFGIDYFALRCVTSALIVLSMVPLYLLARRTIPSGAALILIVLSGLSGSILDFKDAVASEAPYFFFSFLALAVATRAWESGLFRTSAIPLGIATGACCAAAYLSRSVGLALFPAFFLYEIVRFRRVSRFTWIAIATFGLLAAGADRFAHFSGGYEGQFAHSPCEVISHAASFLRELSYVWINGKRHPLRYLTWVVSSALAVIGLYRNFRRGSSFTDWYALIFIAGCSLYHAYDSRYIAPIMPIYLLWAAQGLVILHEKLPAPAMRTIAAVSLLLAFSCEALNIASMDRTPITDGVMNPNFQATLAWLGKGVPADAVTVSWNPRVIGLYTGLVSASPAKTPEWNYTADYYGRIHAGYDILFSGEPGDQARAGLIARHPEAFQRVFANQEFSIYRITLRANRSSLDTR